MNQRAQGGDSADLAAQAADPSTAQSQLHQLAASQPDLRPLIAENLNAYPQLLEWLAGLNDAEVDAALARRFGESTQHVSATDPPTRALPAEGARPTRTPHQPTEEFGAVEQPRSQPETTSQTPSDFDQRVYGASAVPTGPTYAAQLGSAQGPAFAHTPSASYHQGGYPPSAPAYVNSEDDQPPRRRSGGGCTMVFLLALITLAALAATYFLLFGNPLAGQADGNAQPEQQQEYAAPAEEQPQQNQPEPGQTESETQRPSPEESQSAAEGDETDDDELARPAPDDAQDITSFSAPSENIHCSLSDDDVSCTIDEYFFDAPASCDGAVTVRIGSAGLAETACADNISSQGENLDYGQTTGNGDFACEATETYFGCWSQQTGNGFELAREYYSFYDY